MSAPLAASGQPAPVTLVEVMTQRYLITSGAETSGPTFTPPTTLPRALAAGESIAWAIAGSVTPFVVGGGGPVIGGSSGNLFSGSMFMTAGDPLGQHGYGLFWNGYTLPTTIPFGSRIVNIYPVIKGSCSSNGTAVVGGSASENLVNFGSLAGTIYGGSISSLAGATISVDLENTLAGSASLTFTTDFVGFAVIYEAADTTGVASIGDADSQLARGIFLWSEHKAKWPSIITGRVEQFLDFLSEPVEFQLYASTQTDSAKVVIQNISGNTVERDMSKLFSRQELIGAYVYIRVWRGDAEKALLTFTGNIREVDIGDSMTLDISGFGNWSEIEAPSYDVDTACPLTFASKACGSTSPTPCDQTYGTCSSINRFAGVIQHWLIETPDVQLAQPAPQNNFNPQRAF